MNVDTPASILPKVVIYHRIQGIINLMNLPLVMKQSWLDDWLMGLVTQLIHQGLASELEIPMITHHSKTGEGYHGSCGWCKRVLSQSTFKCWSLFLMTAIHINLNMSSWTDAHRCAIIWLQYIVHALAFAYVERSLTSPRVDSSDQWLSN